MGELARSDLPLAARIVTTSPDVTVSTSLGGWVGRREVFSRREHEDVFRAEQVLSPTPWRESRDRASISSSASPRTTCSSTSPASASPTSCSAPGCCRSGRSTIRSSPAGSMR